MARDGDSTIVRAIRKCGISAPAAARHVIALGVRVIADTFRRELVVSTALVVDGAAADDASSGTSANDQTNTMRSEAS